MFNKLPMREPLIKLIPIMKLIGKLTDSSTIRLTLLLFELFCIPIISSKNKQELNKIVKNIFFNRIGFSIIF